jgi:hypothetical protein
MGETEQTDIHSLNRLVYNEAAFVRGKTIDHSGWRGLIPRGGVPSDVDHIYNGTDMLDNVMALDDRGRTILLVEYSSSATCWEATSLGQHRLYRHLVEAGQGRIVAALARFNPHTDRRIDSTKDVVRFQVMKWCPEDRVVVYDDARPGAEWVPYVQGVFSPVPDRKD